MNGGSFANYVNYQNYPSWYKPVPPPLTAIDRFLWGRTRVDHQTQNLEMINEPFSCLAPYLPMVKSFVVDDNSDMFTNDIGECITWEELRSYPNPGRCSKESNKVIEPENNLKNYVKKSKGGGKSKVLIKGQWTEEEDRKLIRLVKEYGERKWALTAEKMTGRAGKQCRERWHNHLRPDIKKDTWSEEEVRMIIQAHQKVGNKWAEIAKLIPGRTENSIKNQWNATKRKQICSRKNKKNDAKNKKPQSSLLEDYIRSKTCDHNLASSSSSITTENSNIIVPELTNPNNDSDSSLNITQSYDDELNFMQTFFQTTTTTTSNESSSQVIEPEYPIKNHSLGFSSNSHCGFSLLTSFLHDENSNMYLNNYPEDDMSKIQLASHVNLLEEAIAMPGSCDNGCNEDGSSSNAKNIWIW